MKVVALVSGGKDSAYNMMQCVAAGHEIVAIAHLRPPVDSGEDELDSPMFQTVGHWGVAAVARCMDLPLFSQQLQGKCVNHSLHYQPADADEVEDMLALLQKVKDAVDVQGVSVGAILSTYQRVRVENVCSRLGLTSLAYLWQRDQEELLPEMIASGVEAVIIKVAAWGLTPSKHLGKTLAEVQADLVRLKHKCQINVCGEGGEYETFTLDCPLFRKRLVMHSTSVVEDPNSDPIAPVAYLKFDVTMTEKVQSRLVANGGDGLDLPVVKSCTANVPPAVPVLVLPSSTSPRSAGAGSVSAGQALGGHSSGLHWIVVEAGTVGSACSEAERVQAEAESVMEALQAQMSALHLHLANVCQVQLYVSDMSNFKLINGVYCRSFNHGPPARACVGVNLPSSSLRLACVAMASAGGGSGGSSSACTERHRWWREYLHVQSISHWAPANIGPYSQSVQAAPLLWVAGQIGLVPGTMALVSGGWRAEGALALRHASRVLEVRGLCLDSCALVTAFVADAEAMHHVQALWTSRCDKMPKILVVLVPSLPRNAAIEWQVLAVSGDPTESAVCTQQVASGGGYRADWSVSVYGSEDLGVKTAALVAEIVADGNGGSIVLAQLVDSLWQQASAKLHDHLSHGNFVQAQCFVEESCAVSGLRDAMEAAASRHFQPLPPQVLIVPVRRLLTGFMSLQLLFVSTDE